MNSGLHVFPTDLKKKDISESIKRLKKEKNIFLFHWMKVYNIFILMKRIFLLKINNQNEKPLYVQDVHVNDEVELSISKYLSLRLIRSNATCKIKFF